MEDINFFSPQLTEMNVRIYELIWGILIVKK